MYMRHFSDTFKLCILRKMKGRKVRVGIKLVELFLGPHFEETKSH